jgi:hypothetical protein
MFGTYVVVFCNVMIDREMVVFRNVVVLRMCRRYQAGYSDGDLQSRWTL